MIREGNSSPAAEGSYVTVHALSEFAFCPRAGLIAQESAAEWEEEIEQARLNYMPRYDWMDIVWRLRHATIGLLNWAVVLSIVAMLTFIASLQYGLLFALVPPMVFIGYLGGRCWRAMVRFGRLRTLWLQARSAVPQQLPTQLDVDVPVNWWRLRASRYVAVSCEEPLADEDLRLVGKPWRILRSGSIRIPAVHATADHLKETHVVRVAAYCHLIEACEGAESPFGVVLLGDGHDGLAVALSAARNERFHASLRAFRQVLREAAAGDDPRPPSSSNVCSECPNGIPILVCSGVENSFSLAGSRLPIRAVESSDGLIYHSLCGDRFGWTPPHRGADELDLL